MRKSLFGFALAAALGAGAAAAGDNGFYVGAAVNQVKIDDIGGDFGLSNINDFEIDDTAWKVIAGIRPLDFFAVEAAYMDLGDGRISAGPFSFRADAKAAAVSVVGFLPLKLPLLDIYGKAGMTHWELDGSFSGTTVADLDEKGDDFSYGAGVQLNFGSLSGRLEYEKFDIEHTDGLEMLSLGLTYTFL